MRFNLLDQILEVKPGQSLRAVKNLTLGEEYLADHFPTFPVMPGVLMLQTLVEAGAWLLRLSEDYRHSVIVLREVKNIKYGNFMITNDLTLEGDPSATLDGLDAGRTLDVETSNIVHLVQLTVTGGKTQTGAGIASEGPLSLKHVTVTGNEAAASSTAAAGGGIACLADITITSSRISSNRATGVGNGSASEGAGLFVGNITITNDPDAQSLNVSAKHAEKAKLLDHVDLKGIYDLRALNDVLGAAGKPKVKAAGLGKE